MANIAALKKSMQEITKNYAKLVYSIFDTGRVVIYINFTGVNAKRDAKACASNWWRAIDTALADTPKFFFRVGVTWIDSNDGIHTEEVSSHNFPRKYTGEPHQKSFEQPKGSPLKVFSTYISPTL